MNETKKLISKFLLISLSMLLCSVVKAEEMNIPLEFSSESL